MRTSLVTVFVVLILSGCASQTIGGPEKIPIGNKTVTVTGLDGFNSVTVQAPQSNGPNVFIDNNAIVIDQEPVRPKDTDRLVIVVWRLGSGSSYSFENDEAIKLQASLGNPLPSDLQCGVAGAKKKAFVCVYTRPAEARKWKYRIAVKNASGPDPDPLDPWVHQP
jgi:hypothetical protein